MKMVLRRTIATLLICVSLISGIRIGYADDSDTTGLSSGTFNNDLALQEVLDFATAHSEEICGQNWDAYTGNSTLQYFSEMINLMSDTSVTRMALESVYGDDVPVYSTVAASNSLWGAVNSDATLNANSYSISSNGNSTVYNNVDSVQDTASMLSHIVDPATSAVLDSCTTPGELFDKYIEIYNLPVTYYGDGHTISAGDTVLFSITATMGSLSAEPSYHQKTYPARGEKIYEDPSLGTDYSIVAGGSVSFTYVGTVISVDSSGVEACLGSIQLSGIGAVGSSGGVADSVGNIVYRKANVPDWNITVSSKFVHNDINIKDTYLKMLKVIIIDGQVLYDDNGEPLTIDCSDEEFKRACERAGIVFDTQYKPTDAFHLTKANYIINYMHNVLGYPEEFALAMVLVMNHESAGTMDPNKGQDGGGPGKGLCQWGCGGDGGRYDNGFNWCNENGYSMTTIEGQLQWMNFELTSGSYSTVLSTCVNYGYDWKRCVQEIVANYEIPRVNYAAQLIAGIDGNGSSFYVNQSDKATLWILLKAEYPEEMGPNNTYIPQTTEIGRTYTISYGQNLSSIAHNMYNGVNQYGFYQGRLEYSYSDAIRDISNLYALSHPDEGYATIGGKTEGGTYDKYLIHVDDKIYLPSEAEIKQYLGIS